MKETMPQSAMASWVWCGDVKRRCLHQPRKDPIRVCLELHFIPHFRLGFSRRLQNWLIWHAGTSFRCVALLVLHRLM